MNDVTAAGDCGVQIRKERSQLRTLAGGLALSLLIAAAPAGAQDTSLSGTGGVTGEQMMGRVRGLLAQGVSVVLVEQNIPAALSVASRIYVLRSGRIIVEESSSAFAARGRENWWNLF